MTLEALSSGRRVWLVGMAGIRKIHLSFILAILGLAPIVLATVSDYFRTAATAAMRRVETWLALGALAGVVLSFGPTIYSHRLPLVRHAPYLFFYLYVPGVNGLRVPARLAMIAILFLSMLAACGFTAIAHRWRKAWVAVIPFWESSPRSKELPRRCRSIGRFRWGGSFLRRAGCCRFQRRRRSTPPLPPCHPMRS